MAWFDRIFGDPGSSSSYRYNEGDEYPAYSDVPRRTYGGWNGSNIFQVILSFCLRSGQAVSIFHSIFQ